MQLVKRTAVALCAMAMVACGGSSSESKAGADNNLPASSSSKSIESEAAGQELAPIGEAYLRRIVAELSDDRYEGREPGSRGDDAARAYMAAEMENMGLRPGAADGGWQQYFELLGMTTSQPPEWTFRHDGDSITLKQWDDFIVSSGVQQARASIDDAELVFVGYGIQAPEFDWDDYKDVDLSGKILLMMNNDPDWDPALFAGDTRLWYGRWDYKYLSAARQGAAGAIIIHTVPSAGYPFQVLQTSFSGVQFELPANDEPRLQATSWITEEAAEQLVAMAGLDLDALRGAARKRDFRPVPLGVTTSIALDVDIQRVRSANVLGLIPGSDPDISDQVVIYTAHHDHLGIGVPNDAGDTIYNGARDNATGVAQTLAIVKAIKALPSAPRRSVLIALVGAEEQGLLGSAYFASNPTFAPGKIAANLNYDSANIWGRTRDVTFVGLGKSSIDAIVTHFAGEQGRVVKADQFPDKGYYYRSDQFSFARIGVPAMYLKTGTDFIDRPPGWGREQQDRNTAVDYHQPSDEYDPNWNFDGMIEDALLGYRVGLAIANADEAPSWTPGDEFEAARQRAVDALSD